VVPSISIGRSRALMSARDLDAAAPGAVVGEREAELVAAESRDGVVCSHRGAQSCGDLDQ
jgi:hypothetical protein